MSHQAVYDVLRALTTAGLVRRIQPAGSVARYEARVGDNHHHVVCRSCGAIADVDCAVGSAPCLTASDDPGFAIDEAEVTYWGLCPECAAATRDPQLTRATHPSRDNETGDGPTCLSRSESENPVIPSPDRQARPAQDQPGLVAEPAGPAGAPPALAAGQPDGRGLRLRGRSSRASTSRR